MKAEEKNKKVDKEALKKSITDKKRIVKNTETVLK